MKIILLTDSLGAGGAQRQLCGLACALQKHGHSVVVVTYHPENFYSPILEENQIDHVLLQNGQNYFKRVVNFVSFAKICKPDAIISFQETPSVIACLSRLFIRTQLLIVSERNTSQRLDFKTYIRFKLYTLSNYITPNSYTQAAFIGKHAGMLTKKIRTIPNFVDTDLFQPNQLRSKSSFRILTPASIQPSKNITGLIDAAYRIRNKGYIFEWHCFGYSSRHQVYFDLCKEKIKKYHLEDVVFLHEKTQQINLEYNKSNVMCLPSFFEGTPNVLCEALSCGIPISCSNVSDNARYVIPGQNGTLFDPNNIDDMASAIMELMNLSEQEFQRYSQNGRRMAIENFSFDIFTSRYLELLKI